MLSNTCKYAIKAIVYLAIHENDSKDHRIGIRQISSDLGIPSPFLAKILQVLSRQKILRSWKGPHGGFAMAENADEYTLFDIVKIFDGNDIFHECVLGLEICGYDVEKQKHCPMHSHADALRQQLFELFNNQRIVDLARDIEKVEAFLKF